MSPDTADLTIDAMLSDPLILAVMRADRVDAADFEATLRVTALRLAASAHRSFSAPVARSRKTCPVLPSRCFA